jgi:hypothetical protein
MAVEDPNVVAASARVHLNVIPVDFDGPICIKCKYSRPYKDTPNPGPHEYVCVAYDTIEIRPAQRNTITGEIHPAWIKYTHCHEKNGNGECGRFESHDDAFTEHDETIPGKVESNADVFAKLNVPLVDSVVNGAQVNHTAVYRLIAFVLGTLAGIAGMTLWS